MLLLLVSLFAGALAFDDYTPQTYPDSMRSPAACGVSGPGYLCDPAGILNKENGTQLRLMHNLVNIQNKTKCICDQLADQRNGQCDKEGLGYIMSIALTQKMVLNDDEKDENTIKRAAEVFADTVRGRQNRGHCQDDILIFLSADDKVVWTSVGDSTKRFLSNEIMNSVSSHAESFFFKKGKYYDGLNYMLNTYANVLNGQTVKVQETKPWYYPLPLWAIIVILSIVGIILLAVIATSIYCCVKKCGNDGRGRYAMTSTTSRL